MAEESKFITKKKPEYWILKGAAYCCAMND